MFDVHIESADFNGKKLVQQHMMVNKVLFFARICIIVYNLLDCCKVFIYY